MRAIALSVLLFAAAVGGASGAAVATDAAPMDEDPCVDSVAFFTVSSVDPPPVRIGYSADANDRVFFVVSAHGKILGHTDLQTYPGHVAVDGQEVPLDEVPAGFTNLTVTVYRDADGNGAFDPNADQACTHEGERVDSTLRFFFPNRTDAVANASATLAPAAAGAVATHQYALTVRESTTLHAVAVDHYGTGIAPDSLSPSDVTVGVNGDPVDVANVTKPGAITTAALADPVSLSPGDRVTLTLEPAKNPRQDRNLTVALNPYGEAWSGDAHLDVEVPPPVSGLTMFPVSDPSPPVKIGFSVEREAPVSFVTFVDGERAGNTAFQSYSPGSSIDGYQVLTPITLTGEHRVTVVAFADVNENGALDDADEPYRENGERVAASQTLDFGDGTSTPTDEPTDAPTDTPTDTPGGGETAGGVPGFGVGVTLLALVGAALLAGRE